MNNKKRLIEFVLHGQPDKFKTVLKEEITNRAVDFLYNVKMSESSKLFDGIKSSEPRDTTKQIQESVIPFYPEASYELKDGNTGILASNERANISKLYENLNNDNRKRLLKLLGESQESFNRIVKLANLESKKDQQ